MSKNNKASAIMKSGSLEFCTICNNLFLIMDIDGGATG